MMFLLGETQSMLQVGLMLYCHHLNLAGIAVHSESNGAADLRDNSTGLSWHIILNFPVMICDTKEGGL